MNKGKGKAAEVADESMEADDDEEEDDDEEDDDEEEMDDDDEEVSNALHTFVSRRVNAFHYETYTNTAYLLG